VLPSALDAPRAQMIGSLILLADALGCFKIGSHARCGLHSNGAAVARPHV